MEKIKNVLLVFLSFTMCLLCYVSLAAMSGKGITMPSWIKINEYRAPNEDSTVYQTAALPYRISVISDGSVHTEQGIDKDDYIYNDCEKLIMEALGSMDEPNECSFVQYRDAALDKSLVIHYNGNMPVWILQMWSGREDGFDGLCRFIVLTKDAAKGVEIYFREANTEKYYKASTSADMAALDEVMAKYVKDNGQIASLANMDILSKENSVLKTYDINREVWAPGQEREEELLRAFKMNPYLAKDYRESSGAKVYVEDDNIVKMSPDGRISYTTKGDGIALFDEDRSLNNKEKTALALNKLKEISSFVYADMPQVSMEAADFKDDEDEAQIGVVIKIDGVPADESALSAGIVIKNSLIVRMWFDVPGIYETGESAVMSDTMAKAAYRKDGRYEIMYTEKSGSLTAVNSFAK